MLAARETADCPACRFPLFFENPNMICSYGPFSGARGGCIHSMPPPAPVPSDSEPGAGSDKSLRGGRGNARWTALGAAPGAERVIRIPGFFWSRWCQTGSNAPRGRNQLHRIFGGFSGGPLRRKRWRWRRTGPQRCSAREGRPRSVGWWLDRVTGRRLWGA